MDSIKQLWSDFKNLCKAEEECQICRNSGIMARGIANRPELQPAEKLKFGQRYQCQLCGGSWFREVRDLWLYPVRPAQLEAMAYWNFHPLKLNSTLLETLVSIGGVAGMAGDFFEVITIPCAADSVSGEHSERAAVIVSRQPPLACPVPLVRWPDSLASVARSPQALSLEIRRASAEKPEEGMDFAPVGVRNSAGQEFTLGKVSEFFDSRGVKGPELGLSGRKKGWKRIVWPLRAEVYYWVDWFVGCEALFE